MEWKGRLGGNPSGFLGIGEVGLKVAMATHEVHPFFQIFCFFIANYDPETFLDEITRNQWVVSPVEKRVFVFDGC